MLMKKEYYILFLVISFIFLLQIGVPLIVDFFLKSDEDDN